MDAFKKIISFLIIAIIFAVAGYFVGRGTAANQGASLYTATKGIPCGDRIPCNPSGDPAPMMVANGTTGPAPISRLGCKAYADITGTTHWNYDDATGCTLYGYLLTGGTAGPKGIINKTSCESVSGTWFQSSSNTGICVIKPNTVINPTGITKTR